jgi:hypothetical protein
MDLKYSDTVGDTDISIGIYAVPLLRKISKVIAIEPHANLSNYWKEAYC